MTTTQVMTDQAMTGQALAGRCLCGAVTVTVNVMVSGYKPKVGACHCTMCRRWSGAAAFLFSASPEQVTFNGPVQDYRSSSFATRAFCGKCGSHLWFRNDGEDYELVPGLFDGAADFPLDHEIYVDQRFACVPLAGDHPTQTAADYEADNPFVDGSLT